MSTWRSANALTLRLPLREAPFKMSTTMEKCATQSARCAGRFPDKLFVAAHTGRNLSVLERGEEIFKASMTKNLSISQSKIRRSRYAD
jgi:hypothetical protein